MAAYTKILKGSAVIVPLSDNSNKRRENQVSLFESGDTNSRDSLNDELRFGTRVAT